MFEKNESIINPDDNLFDVYKIFSNKSLFGIDTFSVNCCLTKEIFIKKFNHMTHGLIDHTFDWSNVVCAGGMVLESICTNELNKYTDIDLFLYGTFDVQVSKAQKLCEYFYHQGLKLFTKAWYGQKESVITICFEDIERVIQIICTFCETKAQCIMDFDFYCNSVLYDGVDIQGLKKWIQCIQTKKTECNPSHILKINGSIKC